MATLQGSMKRHETLGTARHGVRRTFVKRVTAIVVAARNISSPLRA